MAAGTGGRRLNGGTGGGGGGGGKGKGKGGSSYADSSQAARAQQKGRREGEQQARRREEGDAFDLSFGYARYSDGPPRVGWLFNMLPVALPDSGGTELSGLDMYFLEEDGSTFKATLFYEPYFYLAVAEGKSAREIMIALKRRFDSHGMQIDFADKEDLDMPNHLSGNMRRFLKLRFASVSSLMEVKSALLPAITANRLRAEEASSALADFEEEAAAGSGPNRSSADDYLAAIVDIREYDVPYYVRCSIDNDIRVGAWYEVTPGGGGGSTVRELKDMVVKAEPKVLAFDIECTKTALKFPTAESDEVFMISYMCMGQGYLIISRTVVGDDVEDFEYTPKSQFPGPFHIFNEPDEASLLRRFFAHVKELRPQIFVTYNGDFFDWPFVDARATKHGMSMSKEIGVTGTAAAQLGPGGGGEYRGRCSVHMDAFCWVKRDSYLPQGAHGLKAVTRYKLGYDPVEVDPEDMVRLAGEAPTMMASYSVSDAVATYYLYDVYVHLFIFSLCTVIPMGPEDVLRKGSGTLCEALLMAEAFRSNVVCPNKHQDPLLPFHNGHLLESETYVGGHVECLETGVYRSDIPERFSLKPAALQGLIDNVDRDLTFAVEVEHGVSRADIENYDSVRGAIIEGLEMLRDAPLRLEEPRILHLDVAAMYPNIILSNRLQPSAVVDRAECAACVFNTPESDCKRPLKWAWRGDTTPATRAEYSFLRNHISHELVDGTPFLQLPPQEQAKHLKERVNTYARKVYRKTKVTVEEERVDTVCMRENAFYINTVRAFRDRRYDYKMAVKRWKKERDKATDAVAKKIASDKAALFDSLQTAHKCILNSFYGYVMRKGARWRSMEMAGIVTYTGAQLITQARELIEQIGRPLELDTDGVWCILPNSFPDTFTLRKEGGGALNISYPCIMLNADVHERYTNHQYQELVDPATRRYNTRSECSIFFELDGPYRCMVLPSSTDEGRLLKKRYAVFNDDGSLAELKGFELKRRGELEVVKIFQSQVFECFLKGDGLQGCYEAVAEVANHWLDVLDSEGEDLDDEELLELISENKTISQTLAEYGDQKSTSLTTARRIAEFLGDEMVKDRGLNCRLIICNRPAGAPVTERAVPTHIFSAEDKVKKHFVRKWLKDPAMEDFDIRSLLDWGYYRERLGKSIQKIITIPAAMQKITNPVPRIPHPDWLQRIVREKNDKYKQRKIDTMFSLAPPPRSAAGVGDLEDIAGRVPGKVAGLMQSRKHNLVLEATAEAGTGSTQAPSAMEVSSETGAKFPITTPTPVPEGASPGELATWLSEQKGIWKAQRIKRRTASKVQSAVTQTGDKGDKRRRGVTMGSGGVAGYLRAAEEALIHGVWQILSISPAPTAPGQYTAWVMTGPRELNRVTLEIPRTFYVNARKLPERLPDGMRRVKWELPRGRERLDLLQIKLGEEQLVRGKEIVSSFLRDPNVEGVYELQMPLVFRAILSLGCQAQVTAEARRRMKQDRRTGGTKFSLDDLEFVNSQRHHYLAPSVASFKRIYIYASHSGNRGILGLFFLDDDGLEDEAVQGNDTDQPPMRARAMVWFAQPAGALVQRLPLGRFFESHSPAPGSTCQFTSGFSESMAGVWAQADAMLTDHARSMPGATVVIAQVPADIDLAGPSSSIPALSGFPVVRMPSNTDDARYPALNWQAFAAQRMLQRLGTVRPWMGDRLLAAQYARIPLGNLGEDAPIAMADAMFARQLEHNRCVLWASPSPMPDLGGAEGDDSDLWAEELTSPSISNPGAHRATCIELSIFGLGVASIMASAELEGDRNGQDGPGAAFRIMRVLVGKWLKDAAVSADPHADALLQHFYRWICASHSMLSDPALHRLVHRLMRKVFFGLVAEFKKLGARVVHASFHKIVIATDKEGARGARDYAQFLADTITSKSIFSCIQLVPVRYWQSLLFLDESNYGGIALTPPAESTGEELDYLSRAAAAPDGWDAEGEANSAPRIVSHWDVAEQLIPEVRQMLLVMVGEFLLRPWQHAQQMHMQRMEVIASLSSSHPGTQSRPNAAPAEGTYRAMIVQERLMEESQKEAAAADAFIHSLVTEKISPKLLNTLPEVCRLDGSAGGLALVKSLCTILEVDDVAAQAVEVMRKQALASLGLRQFGSDAARVLARSSLVLPDVICSYCNLCIDLDLCRDPSLSSSDDPEHNWLCERCGARHDVAAIELRLVEWAWRESTTYQIQDLRCGGRCRGKVVTRMLAVVCECCSDLVCEAGRSPADARQRLETMHNISLQHSMSWLQETTELQLGLDGVVFNVDSEEVEVS